MKRMKEAWDEMYGNNQMSAQTLRYNAVRFRKDKSLLNPGGVEPTPQRFFLNNS